MRDRFADEVPPRSREGAQHRGNKVPDIPGIDVKIADGGGSGPWRANCCLISLASWPGDQPLHLPPRCGSHRLAQPESWQGLAGFLAHRLYRALVSSASDEPRFLGKRVGYVADPHRGMSDEPEALTEREQLDVTRRARLRWERERARVWGVARVEILASVAHFKAVGHPDRRLMDDLRGIERGVVRVDRHLGELGREVGL